MDIFVSSKSDSKTKSEGVMLINYLSVSAFLEVQRTARDVDAEGGSKGGRARSLSLTL